LGTHESEGWVLGDFDNIESEFGSAVEKGVDGIDDCDDSGPASIFKDDF